MMISRAMYSVLPIVAVISAGNIWCGEGLVAKVNANKYTLGAIAFGTGLPQGSDAAKASIETMGVVMDSVSKINPLTVPVNFGINWVARKAMHGLGANKLKLSGFGSTGNDAVGVIIDAVNVATPQIIATLVVMAINGSSTSSR